MTNTDDKNDIPPASVPPEPETRDDESAPLMDVSTAKTVWATDKDAPFPKIHKGDTSFSLNSFAVLPALLAVPVFFAKNDYGIEIIPQWIYQLVTVASEGLLFVLILRFIYGAYSRCFEIDWYSGDELPTLVSSGVSFKWKDFVTQAGRRNLALGALVLASLIYLFLRRL